MSFRFPVCVLVQDVGVGQSSVVVPTTTQLWILSGTLETEHSMITRQKNILNFVKVSILF